MNYINDCGASKVYLFIYLLEPVGLQIFKTFFLLYDNRPQKNASNMRCCAGRGAGGGPQGGGQGRRASCQPAERKLLYVSFWRYTKFRTWKKSRNSVKFRGISRNYPTRNSAEFRRNFCQFRTEYGIDGSKKNRRNSVSTEFRGHPKSSLA